MKIENMKYLGSFPTQVKEVFGRKITYSPRMESLIGVSLTIAGYVWGIVGVTQIPRDFYMFVEKCTNLSRQNSEIAAYSLPLGLAVGLGIFLMCHGRQRSMRNRQTLLEEYAEPR